MVRGLGRAIFIRKEWEGFFCFLGRGRVCDVDFGVFFGFRDVLVRLSILWWRKGNLKFFSDRDMVGRGCY